MPSDAHGRTAFVLGGGGVLGAAEAGMLTALLESQVVPDVIVGTSVGAINGALTAVDLDGAPTRLFRFWQQVAAGRLGGSPWQRTRTLVRSRTHVEDPARLRVLLEAALPVRGFADLEVEFACVAASIERAGAHWFTSGSVVDAVMASSAVPGLFPPVTLDDGHYLDGGLVDSIPVDRALDEGAGTVYVLQVGRIEQPLRVPRRPHEVALVAFEIARRHRFNDVMRSVPDHVDVHVLPTGAMGPADYDDVRAQLRYDDVTSLTDRIEAARSATRDYLATRAGR